MSAREGGWEEVRTMATSRSFDHVRKALNPLGKNKKKIIFGNFLKEKTEIAN